MRLTLGIGILAFITYWLCESWFAWQFSTHHGLVAYLFPAIITYWVPRIVVFLLIAIMVLLVERRKFNRIKKENTASKTEIPDNSTSKSALNHLSKTIAEGIVIHENGKVIQANEYIRFLFGYQDIDIIGREVLDFIHEKDHQIVREAIHNKEHKPYQLIGIKRDGSYIPIEITPQILEHAGHSIRVVTVSYLSDKEELSEALKHSMDTIQRSREFLQLIIDMIPEMIFWKDTESRYLGCNAQFLVEHQIASRDAILNKTDYELENNPARAEHDIIWDKRIMETRNAELNELVERPVASGEIKTFHASKIPLIDKYKKVIGVIGVYHDITEQISAEKAIHELNIKLEHQNAELLKMNTHLEESNKEFERINKELETAYQQLSEKNQELIEAKNKAEEANRAKSEFLANISHELRTPLFGMLGYTQLIQREKSLNPTIRPMLQTIQTSGEHLQSIIDDLLNITAIEAGHNTYHEEVFVLNELVQNTINMMQTEITHRKLELKIKVPELMVKTDSAKLRQILLNLLSNAMKFTNQGSITITAEQKDGQVIMGVIDTGIGIKEEKLSQVFEMFYQIDGSSKKTYGGVGLGLAIVKRFVEKMGGTIWVESNYGEGSTFWFTFKNTLLNEKYPSNSMPIPHSMKPKHEKQKNLQILIGDDDDTTQDILLDFFGSNGLNPIFAKNGAEVLEKIHKDIDIIILDMQMPIKDGFTCAQELKNIPEFRHIPIIAVTAYTHTDDKEKCFQVGCNDYLSKPYKLDELLDKINRLCSD